MSRRLFRCRLLAGLAAAASAAFACSSVPDRAGDAADARVEDLLRRMTLEEKVGQMNMPCVYESALGKTDEEKARGVRAFTLGTHLPGLGPGAFFTLPNTILHKGTRQRSSSSTSCSGSRSRRRGSASRC